MNEHLYTVLKLFPFWKKKEKKNLIVKSQSQPVWKIWKMCSTNTVAVEKGLQRLLRLLNSIPQTHLSWTCVVNFIRSLRCLYKKSLFQKHQILLTLTHLSTHPLSFVCFLLPNYKEQWLWLENSLWNFYFSPTQYSSAIIIKKVSLKVIWWQSKQMKHNKKYDELYQPAVI